jgi:hypothetical protein
MVLPGAISIVLGPLLRVKLKSGGDGPGGVLVVFELTELDVIEDVAVVLEDVVVLDGEVVLAVEVLDIAVVLVVEAFRAGFG